MNNHYFTRFLVVLALSMTIFISKAQQQEGYTLYSLSGSSLAILMDTAGTTVHTWTTNAPTRYSQYMMGGGVLVRTCGTGFSITPTHGGMYTKVQKWDYNNNLLWEWSLNTPTYCLHHDIAPMPNGNILVIVAVKVAATDFTLAGGTTNTAIANYLSEEVWEVEPVGSNTVNVVWKWKMWDHLVQNLYPTRANYQPSIVTNPQLININYNVQADLMHMNGIDYNPVLDQIALSSRYKDEIYVLDHSTTTAEAAAHTGGYAGKGGDIIYRWGNPAAYQAVGPKILDANHDSHWIPEGCPDAGYLVALNISGVTTPSARTCVDRVAPPRVGYTYTITPGAAFTPSQATGRYMSPVQIAGYSNSVQFKNGNMQMCFTTGNIWETNPAGTTIWSKYVGPGFSPQAHRYPSCFILNPATPQPTLTVVGPFIYATSGNFDYQWYYNGNAVPNATLNYIVPSQNGNYLVRVTDPNGCDFLYSDDIYFVVPPPPPPPTGFTELSVELNNLRVYPNPNSGLVNIGLKGFEEYTVNVFNSNGSLVLTEANARTIDMSGMSNGLYFVSITTSVGTVTKKITLVK